MYIDNDKKDTDGRTQGYLIQGYKDTTRMCAMIKRIQIS